MGVRGGVHPHAHPFRHPFLPWAEWLLFFFRTILFAGVEYARIAQAKYRILVDRSSSGGINL
jgi:hypothetical protein